MEVGGNDSLATPVAGIQRTISSTASYLNGLVSKGVSKGGLVVDGIAWVFDDKCVTSQHSKSILPIRISKWSCT